MTTVLFGVFSDENDITDEVMSYYNNPEDNQQLLETFPVDTWEVREIT